MSTRPDELTVDDDGNPFIGNYVITVNPDTGNITEEYYRCDTCKRLLRSGLIRITRIEVDPGILQISPIEIVRCVDCEKTMITQVTEEANTSQVA